MNWYPFVPFNVLQSGILKKAYSTINSQIESLT